ncbi:MAG: hypothetical protein RIC89_19155 [Pseudomonadales bacterium]
MNQKEILENASQYYFGGCPECGNNDGYMNVSSNHICVCDTHKTAWRVGSNLFSDWKDESEEVWAHNAKMLESYREVTPVRAPHTGPESA